MEAWVMKVSEHSSTNKTLIALFVIEKSTSFSNWEMFKIRGDGTFYFFCNM